MTILTPLLLKWFLQGMCKLNELSVISSEKAFELQYAQASSVHHVCFPVLPLKMDKKEDNTYANV